MATVRRAAGRADIEYGSRMQRKWLILTAVSLGSLMATLDGSIVNIALPAIQTDFGIDLTTI